MLLSYLSKVSGSSLFAVALFSIAVGVFFVVAATPLLASVAG
jgi:hypothetical protein